MTTARVQQVGDDLVIKLSPEARSALGVCDGDTVVISRSVNGDVSLAAADADHHLRLDRGRAFLRRSRS